MALALRRIGFAIILLTSTAGALAGPSGRGVTSPARAPTSVWATPKAEARRAARPVLSAVAQGAVRKISFLQEEDNDVDRLFDEPTENGPEESTPAGEDLGQPAETAPAPPPLPQRPESEPSPYAPDAAPRLTDDQETNGREAEEIGWEEPPAPTQSSGEWFGDGLWYTQLDAIFLSRSVGRNDVVHLMTDTSGGVLGKRLTTPVSLGFEPGLRITLGRFFGRDERNRDHSLEFTFLGLNHWAKSDGLQAITDDSLRTNRDPFFPSISVAGFNSTDVSTYSYQSNLDSFELNYRISRRLGRDRLELTPEGEWVRKADPRGVPSVFAGFRVLTLDEDFDWQANNSATPVTRSGRYSISTENELYGLQMGADLNYQQEEWRVGIRGKGGVFANVADQFSRVTFVDTTPPPNRDEHAHESVLAFVGEVNLMGAYYFRPNMAFRASYDLMWINQLAMAPEQIDFYVHTPARLVTGGNLFLHGMSVGLEMTW